MSIIKPNKLPQLTDGGTPLQAGLVVYMAITVVVSIDDDEGTHTSAEVLIPVVMSPTEKGNDIQQVLRRQDELAPPPIDPDE
jgi:hypothetical protein